jgi:RNA ligase (TIGR02306 family)
VTRKLVRLERIDAIRPIEGADAIEAAVVGGWTVVVKKGEFSPGDTAVYFEIDSFLPEGNSAWQFLVDKSSRQFNERKGHVLRTVKLRGQVSQGLLLSPGLLGDTAAHAALGDDLAEQLGVQKYEPPVPAELAGTVRGNFPSRVPKTDQERVQNLAAELEVWRREAQCWEVTEKLEGSSCTFAWLDDELHVCSRNLDLTDTPENTLWRIARELDIATKFAKTFAGRNLALQGELIGYGIQGNIYGLRGQQFHLFDVYDADQGRYLGAEEREALARDLDVSHTPVLERAFVLDAGVTMQSLLAMADGFSALNSKQLREGLVFKNHSGKVSFKVVSNRYLLKQ